MASASGSRLSWGLSELSRELYGHSWGLSGGLCGHSGGLSGLSWGLSGLSRGALWALLDAPREPKRLQRETGETQGRPQDPQKSQMRDHRHPKAVKGTPQREPKRDRPLSSTAPAHKI